MTELHQPEREQESRRWIVQAIGAAFGLAVLIVAAGAFAIIALESPSARSARAAASIQADQSVNTGPEQAPAGAPSLADPPGNGESAPSHALPAGAAATTAISMPTQTPLPTELLLPTATSTVVPTPLPTATPVPTLRSAPALVRKPATTTAPEVTPEPLGFYFYTYAYCHKYNEDNLLVVDLHVTGHGGQPPYDYYNDTTPFAQGVDGLARLTVKAPSGNPVPFKIVIVDSTGQKYTEDFFYKSRVRCRTR